MVYDHGPWTCVLRPSIEENVASMPYYYDYSYEDDYEQYEEECEWYDEELPFTTLITIL